MSRPTQARIEDIRAAVAAIRAFYKSGRGEPMVFDAIRMRLLEIGEAANGIPTHLRETGPTVPWIDIIGTRDWIAHPARQYHARLCLGDSTKTWTHC